MPHKKEVDVNRSLPLQNEVTLSASLPKKQMEQEKDYRFSATQEEMYI